MSEKLDVSYSLTEEEKRIFRKFKRSNSAKLTKSEFQTMLRSKLVDGGFGGEYYWFSNGSFDEGVACLSENGLRVKAAMRAEKKLSVRYWITTGVAIAGFLLAVLSLLMQHGIISLCRYDDGENTAHNRDNLRWPGLK